MVFSEESCFAVMRRGTYLCKIRRGKRYSRTYYLDETRSYLYWSPTFKKTGSRSARIILQNLLSVKRGLHSTSTALFGEETLDDTAKYFFSLTYQTNHGHASDSQVHADGHGVYQFMALTREDADIWVVGLRYLMRRLHGAVPISCSSSPTRPSVAAFSAQDEWLRLEFRSKVGYDGTLSLPAAVDLLTKLSPVAHYSNITHFYSAGYRTDGFVVSENDFVGMFEAAAMVPQLWSIIFLYSHSGDVFLTNQEILSFIQAELGITNVGSNFVEHIVIQYEPIPVYRDNGVMGILGIAAFLLSPHADVVDLNHRSIHQDMNLPVAHYFINASHNTYLTGDQILSDSSPEMYAQLLLAGVRYIEVDIWDGENGEPMLSWLHAYI